MVMNMLLILLLSVTRTIDVRVTPDNELFFRITVPASWAYSEERFSVAHYRDVMISMNSANIADLKVKDWVVVDYGKSRGVRYGSEYIGRQLPGGVVYMDVAEISGPPLSYIPYCWTREDSQEYRISNFLANPEPVWDVEDMLGYRTGFRRWGRLWEVAIYCRKPINEKALLEAFDILRSIEVPDIPICDPLQAVEYAIPYLPESMRPQRELLEPCSEIRRFYNTVSTPHMNGFVVEFQILDGSDKRTVVRSTKYFVSTNGQVREINLQD